MLASSWVESDEYLLDLVVLLVALALLSENLSDLEIFLPMGFQVEFRCVIAPDLLLLQLLQACLEFSLRELGIVVLLVHMIVEFPQGLHLLDVIGVRVLHPSIEEVLHSLGSFAGIDYVSVGGMHLPFEIVLHTSSDLPSFIGLNGVGLEFQGSVRARAYILKRAVDLAMLLTAVRQGVLP
jgi:hypothetical protein